MSLDYDGGKTCELRLTFRGEGAGNYSFRCGGAIRSGAGELPVERAEPEAPEITSLGPFEVVENRTRVGQLEAVDPDEGDGIGGYGIAGGADGGLFAVVEETGELQFREAPDYEAPADVASAEPESGAGDNEYVVVVEVRSGEGERERKGERSDSGEGELTRRNRRRLPALARSRWWRTGRGWGNWRRWTRTKGTG